MPTVSSGKDLERVSFEAGVKELQRVKTDWFVWSKVTLISKWLGNWITTLIFAAGDFDLAGTWWYISDSEKSRDLHNITVITPELFVLVKVVIAFRMKKQLLKYLEVNPVIAAKSFFLLLLYGIIGHQCLVFCWRSLMWNSLMYNSKFSCTFCTDCSRMSNLPRLIMLSCSLWLWP